jgi:hypothetical protein
MEIIRFYYNCLDKHPDIEDINENNIEVPACSLNEKRKCNWYTTVHMKKCNGNLLYSFPWLNHSNPDILNLRICLGK